MKKLILPLVIIIIFVISFSLSSSFFKDHINDYYQKDESPSESNQYINVNSFVNFGAEYVESASLNKTADKRNGENGNASCIMEYEGFTLDETNSNLANINLTLNNKCREFFSLSTSDFEKSSSPDSDEVYKYTCKCEVTKNSGGILSIKQTVKFSYKDMDTTNYRACNFNLSTGRELLLTDLFSMTYAKTSKYIKDKITNYVDEKYADDDINLDTFRKTLDNYDIFNFIYYIEDDYICLFFPDTDFNKIIDSPFVIDIPN